MKRAYLFYNQNDEIRQQLVDELENLIFSIPWGHEIAIISKLSTLEQAVFICKKRLKITLRKVLRS